MEGQAAVDKLDLDFLQDLQKERVDFRQELFHAMVAVVVVVMAVLEVILVVETMRKELLMIHWEVQQLQILMELVVRKIYQIRPMEPKILENQEVQIINIAIPADLLRRVRFVDAQSVVMGVVVKWVIMLNVVLTQIFLLVLGLVRLMPTTTKDDVVVMI